MYQPDNVTVPCSPVFTCCSQCRSAEHYGKCIEQFDVAGAARYTRRDTSGDGLADTFCNIFAADVAKAMGCELPHWWKGQELSANRLHAWLGAEGSHYGWEKVTPHVALGAASAGMLTVASWQNPHGGPGHIAVVMPVHTADGVPLIAQAGRHNFIGKRLPDGFGKAVPELYTCCR